ncbi:MAG: TlpA disulfide reductase family protein [bacterium]
MKRTYWIFVAALLVALIGGTLASRWRDGTPEAGGATAATVDPAGGADPLQAFLIERPQEPVQAEPFTAVAVNGASPRLQDYAGKYILLNFWATWCGPCKQELPELQALYESLKEQNFVVLAVSMSETEEKVAHFLEDTGFTFPVLVDVDGSVSELYGVNSIPLTYLIDTDGWIEARALGPREWNDPALQAYFRRMSAQ